MFPRKQLTTILVLLMLVAGGVAAVNHPASDFKNLKVLPKDISEEKLDSIMESYNKALGVGCKFCHVKDSILDKFDYASDSIKFKDEAREMMRMTIHINKTYFYFSKNKQPEDLTSVTCMTCHRGEAYLEEPFMPLKPENSPEDGKKKKRKR